MCCWLKAYSSNLILYYWYESKLSTKGSCVLLCLSGHVFHYCFSQSIIAVEFPLKPTGNWSKKTRNAGQRWSIKIFYCGKILAYPKVKFILLSITSSINAIGCFPDTKILLAVVISWCLFSLPIVLLALISMWQNEGKEVTAALRGQRKKAG